MLTNVSILIKSNIRIHTYKLIYTKNLVNIFKFLISFHKTIYMNVIFI